MSTKNRIVIICPDQLHSYSGFTHLDFDPYEIVAMVGGSLGWYLALALSGALDWSVIQQLIEDGNSPMSLPRVKAERKHEILSPKNFHPPTYPLIDERGYIWKSYSTDSEKLGQYTLHLPTNKTPNLTKSILVALKEYNPDHLMILGDNTSLSKMIESILIQLHWRGIRDENQFLCLQNKNPFLLSIKI